MHIIHVEDGILESGFDGAIGAIDCIIGAIKFLIATSDQTVTITTKWDGNPALFVGQHPENGKFFVGTKGIFSKSNPRICYTASDIDRLYGDVPTLADRLHAALKYLPMLGIEDCILQGDIMFGPNDVEERRLGDEWCATFHPNTIMYAVSLDSEQGSMIHRAKLGVIFHTVYRGPTISELEASFNISLNGLNRPPEVWYDDASYGDAFGSMEIGSWSDEIIEATAGATTALASLSEDDFRKLFSNKTFIGLLKQYQNYLIRGGQQIDNIDEWLAGLPYFLNVKVEGEKTSDEAKVRKIKRLSERVKDLYDILAKVLFFQKQIIAAKHLIIEHLESAKTFGTFHITVDNKIVEAKQEGFVVIDHEGNAVKLVDRLEFTRHHWTTRGAE